MDSPIENLSALSYIPQAPEPAPDFVGNNPTTSNLGNDYTGLPSFQTAPVDLIRQSIDNPIAPSEQLKYQPQTFNYEKSQAARYVNDPNFQVLNFNPNIGAENEYRYGKMQTAGQMWSNALGGAYRLGKQTFVEGWKGWGNMADAVFTNFGHVGEGTYWENFKKDLVGTPEHLMELDKETKDIMNRYAIYRTPESEQSVWNRQLFGTMLQQSGFALGATAQFLTEELLTAGFASGFGLSKLGAKSVMVGGKSASVGEVIKNTLRLNSPWKLDNVMSGVYNTAVNVLRPLNMGQEFTRAAMAGASATQLAKIGLGGTKRLFAEMNMATTEARMEAAGTYGDLYNRLVEDHTNKTGRAPIGAELTRIQNMAQVGADQNFVVNTGVIATMNRIQFDNLFTRFGLERRVLKEMGQYADDVLKVTGKTVAKEGEEAAAKEITKVYAKGAMGTLGTLSEVAKDFGTKRAAWEGAKAFGKNMFKWEASEGVQELIQEGSNTAIQDYYRDLYNGNPASWDKSIRLAAAEQNPLTSIQGAQTFLMGAMTGRMIAPIMSGVQKAQELAMNLNKDYKDQKQKRQADLESSVTLINKFFESPSKVLSEHIANIQVQDAAAKDMEVALANRDEYHYNNAKDSAFAKMISAAKKTSMFESVLDTIREYGNHLTDEQMKEAFPAVDPTENNITNAKQYFNRIASEVEDFSKSWEELQDKYGDLVMPELYKEGSEGRKQAESAKMALNNAIEILATNKFKAERAGKRLTDLYTKVSKNQVIGNSSAEAFRILGNENLMSDQLELLEREIAVLGNPAMKLDSDGRATLKSKKKELTRLKRWQEEWTKSEGKDRMAKRGITKLKRAYADYLQVRNESSKIDQPVSLQDIDMSWETFLDHNELAKDNQDYIDAFNTLANPAAMNRILTESTEAILDLVSKLREEAIARAEKEEAKKKKKEDIKEKILTEDTIDNEFGLKIVKNEDDTYSILDKTGNIIPTEELLTTLEDAKAELAYIISELTPDEEEEVDPEEVDPEEEEDPTEKDDEGREFNIVPLKQTAVNMTPPTLKQGEEIKYSENGIFVVYGLQKLYTVMDGDRKDPETGDANFLDTYGKLNDSVEAVKELLAKRSEIEVNRRKPYEFGDKTVRAGQVLIENATGKRFKVKSEGGPEKGKVNLKLLRDDLTETSLPVVSVTPEQMTQEYDYSYKGEKVSTDDQPKMQRWFRTNELTRVYPVKKNGETDEQAQKRLDKILLTTPAAMLAKGITVRVSANSFTNPKETIVLGNPRLKRVPEQVRMEVLFNGVTIGFITNGPSFRYYNSKGSMFKMSELKLADFKQIFDAKDKDINEAHTEFTIYAEHAEYIHAQMLRLLKENKDETFDLTGDELAKIINFVPGLGEFVFQPERIRFKDLPYNTIDGHIFILDRQRRYKSNTSNDFSIVKGLFITSAISDEDVTKIETEVAQVLTQTKRDTLALMGRYVAVVKTPNGKIRFIELVTDTLEDATLTDLISRMEQRRQEAKDTNITDTIGLDGKIQKGATDNTFTEPLNNELTEKLFISLSDAEGTYVDLGVSPTGNVYMKFNMRKPGSEGVITRVVNVQKPDFSSNEAFIDSLNNGIQEHNKVSTDKNIIPITLSRENFKESISRYPSASEMMEMGTRVASEMIKNIGLSVTASKDAATAVPDLVPVAQPAAVETPEVQPVETTEEEEVTEQTEEETAIEKRRALVAEKKQYIKTRTAELIAGGMDEFDADDKAQADADKKYDPELDRLKDQINNLLKVTNRATFDQAAVERLDKFKAWVKANLPESISVEEMDMVIDRLRGNMVTAGMFISYLETLQDGTKAVRGKIRVGENAPFKYHEAFHAVFRLLLSDKRIEQLLAVARVEALAKLKKEGKSFDEALKEMKSQHVIYESMNRQELERRYFEEYMADEFENFMLNPNKSTIAPGIKGWFQKLIDWIKRVFSRLTGGDIQGLFKDIADGRYKNSNIKRNQFTKETALDVTEPAMKVLRLGEKEVEDENGRLIPIDENLSESESDQLASTIASLYHMEALKQEKHNKNKILDIILNKYAKLYDLNDEAVKAYYKERMNELFPDPDSPTYAEDRADFRRRIKNYYNLFKNRKNRQIMKESVNTHLQIMGYKQNLEDDDFVAMVDDYGDRVTTDSWKETHSIGGFGALSQFLRQYIAATTYEASDDFGNTVFLDGTPILKAVNANLVYNGLLKALSNKSSQAKMVQRMQQILDPETETGKFVQKFFLDTGLVINEDGSFEVTNSAQATLFQSVIKGLQQYSVDYIFINKDVKKRVARLSLANWNSAVKTQFSQWYNAYLTVFEREQLKLGSKAAKEDFAAKRVKGVQMFNRLMDPKVPIDDAALENYAKEISRKIKLDLGMSISPMFIKFSVAAVKEEPTPAQANLLNAYDDVKPITKEFLTELEISIKNLENPFAKNIDTLNIEEQEALNSVEGLLDEEDVEEESDDFYFDGETAYEYGNKTANTDDGLGTGGVVGRINDIAKGNAVFDETVSTSSFKNAEGELVYTYQLPTFHLVKTTELNDKETVDKLLEDPFLENNTILNSPEFDTLRGHIQVARIEGLKQSILNKKGDDYTENKMIASNQNKGITYGGYEGLEFLVSLFDLYKYSKKYKTDEGKSFMTSQSLIRVLEASNTGDTVNLPVFAAVRVDETGENAALSKEALNRLYIAVENEFNRIRTVTKEIKQIEKGTFKGDVIWGYHTKDKGKTERGLQFHSFRNALGPLAEKLEKAAQGKGKLDELRNEMFVQLNKYFMGQVDNLIERMIDMNILNIYKDSETGELKIGNRLVDNFIYTGMQTADNKEDESKNALLNLVPGQIRHNIAQIFMNNFINVQAFNDILLGDQAMGIKDPVDAAKRARLSNASGASIATEITARELGINNTLQSVGFMIFTDPQYKAKYAGGNKDKADAQMYMTAKGQRYTLFGLGKLNKQLANYLDKIEAGEELDVNDIYGEGGLKDINGMFNSMKLVHANRVTIKTSAVMLTKELTSMKVNGKWVALPGKEDLHALRERMEAYEAKYDTVAFAGPRSLAKTVQRNVFSHQEGFDNAQDKNFHSQDANFWRLQLENPSNKIVITDPTQAKMLITAEQDDNLTVNFMGENIKMGKLKKMYLSDTEQRIKNNFKTAAKEIFDIEGAYDEYSKSISVDRLTPRLDRFLKRAVETLRASGSDEQTIEFFTTDKDGKQVYDLNHPVTLTKFTQLFLAYFSKGVMSEKIPGHSLALMSNYGMKVVKRFTGRRDEDGTPIGDVIPVSEVRVNPERYKGAKNWSNDQDREFPDLEEGEYYIDDLRHNVPEYDKKGNITGRYSEFMMPPHFKEYMERMGKEAFEDFITKAFGVRIPSQDKHSFISLKLVDWMPTYYGSTGVFPHELIEISGADFDIDKLYMQITDTFIKDGDRIAYGTAKTDTGKFEEYIAYLLDHSKEYRQEVRKVLVAIMNEQRIEFYDEKSKKYQELNNRPKLERREVIRDYLLKHTKQFSPEGIEVLLAALSDQDIDRLNLAAFKEKGKKFHNTKDSLEEMAAEYAETEEEKKIYFERFKEIKRGIQQFNLLRNAIKDEFKALDDTEYTDESSPIGELSLDTVDMYVLEEALSYAGLPSDVKEFKAASKKGELNNGVLNNRILAQKLLMINNEAMTKAKEGETPVAFQVASTDPLKDLVKALREEFKGTQAEKYLKEDISDIDSMIGQLDAFVNNKEGSRLIGPAVNAMLSFSFLSTNGVKFRKNYIDQYGQEQEFFRLKVNGEVFEGYTKLTTQESERIFFVISTIVSAMTDNAKDRLAARFGLDMEAVGILSNLIAQGMGLKSAVMFIMQPAVRQYFDMRRAQSYTLGSTTKKSKKEILQEIAGLYPIEEGTEMPELTDELFSDSIKRQGNINANQRAVLSNFWGVINQTEYFSKVAQLIKTTKGVGTDMASLDKLVENANDLGIGFDPAQFEETPVPFDLNPALEQHKFLKTLIDIATKQVTSMSKVLFIERTTVFQDIAQAVKVNLNIKRFVIDTFNKNLNQDLISYLSILAYRKKLMEKNRQGTLKTMTNALIYDDAAKAKGDDFDDITDIVSMIRTKMPNNYLTRNFLNLIKTFRRDANGKDAPNELNRDGFNKLESNTWSKLSDYMIKKLSNSFVELYGSDIDFDGKGANGRDMARALFNYLLVKDGGQFRSNSFIRYVPPFMFKDLMDATALANDLLKHDNMSVNNDRYKELFGLTADELINEFVKGYTMHKGNEPYLRTINTDAVSAIKLNNKAADEFKAEGFQVRKNSIKVSLFAGIRKSTKQLQEEAKEKMYADAGIRKYTWTDAEENVYTDYEEEFQPMSALEELDAIADAKQAGIPISIKAKKGEYSEDEIMMLVKNKLDLQAKGFTVTKQGILCPYVIKTITYDPFEKRTQRQSYILKVVNNKGGKKAGQTADLLSVMTAEDLAKGYFIPRGTEAVYVPFDAKGSAKTFKAGFVFDEIPALAVTPRKKSSKAEGLPDAYYATLEDRNLTPVSPEEQAMLDMGVTDVQPKLSSAAGTAKEKLADFGIKMEMVKGKFEFSGALYDAVVKKAGMNFTNPQDVLKAINAMITQTTAEPKQDPLNDECAKPATATNPAGKTPVKKDDDVKKPVVLNQFGQDVNRPIRTKAEVDDFFKNSKFNGKV
jgi:hypothetical protein